MFRSQVENRHLCKKYLTSIFKLKWWSLHNLSSKPSLWCLSLSCEIFEQLVARNKTWFCNHESCLHLYILEKYLFVNQVLILKAQTNKSQPAVGKLSFLFYLFNRPPARHWEHTTEQKAVHSAPWELRVVSALHPSYVLVLVYYIQVTVLWTFLTRTAQPSQSVQIIREVKCIWVTVQKDT